MFANASKFSQRSELTQLEQTAFDAYRSSDSALGEKLLLRHANHLQDLIEMGLTTEIPGMSDLRQKLVLTYGRLGRLLEAGGSQNKSREYYGLALQCWNSMKQQDAEGEKTVEMLQKLIATFDAIEENSQPASGASGSQPIRSETNRTSAAAGSRR